MQGLYSIADEECGIGHGVGVDVSAVVNSKCAYPFVIKFVDIAFATAVACGNGKEEGALSIK